MIRTYYKEPILEVKTPPGLRLWRLLAVGLILTGIILAQLGCRSHRIVYVPHGEPVRIKEDVPDVEVWVKDDEGDWVGGRMTLPGGWWALPDPGEAE